MRQLVKFLSLLLLLLAAQQGAVVHELSHVAGVGRTETTMAAGVTETACGLCPAFAQANTPAFSHSFQPPPLVRAALDVSPEPRIAMIESAAPRARSRGPPV
jgi:hypothetical protein